MNIKQRLHKIRFNWKLSTFIMINQQDFYSLKHFKEKIQKIDAKYQQKVAQINSKVDQIQDQYSQAMNKLKIQKKFFLAEIQSIFKMKFKPLGQKIQQLNEILTKIEKVQDAEKLKIEKNINLKSKIFKKQIQSVTKTLKSSQNSLKLRFLSIKNQFQRKITDESQKRKQFEENIMDAIVEMTNKVQSFIKNK